MLVKCESTYGSVSGRQGENECE